MSEARDDLLIRLLRGAKCPDPECSGRGWVAVQVGPDDFEQQQCQWCDERNAICYNNDPDKENKDG